MARQPGPTNRPRAAAWLVVGLMVAARALRSRDFYQKVIVDVIVLAALARIAREGLGRSARGLVAWEEALQAELEEERRRQRQAKASQPAAS